MTDTSIALNMIRGMYHVGDDVTQGSVDNSTTETELLDFVIPANTVSNGIVIRVAASVICPGGTDNNGTIRIKVGDDASEVTKATFILRTIAGGNETQAGFYEFVYDGGTWTSEQSVSITGENSAEASGATTFGEYLNITGY